MEANKKEVNELINSLGNESETNDKSPNFVDWMKQNNPMEQNPEIKKKPGCKSGGCGNDRKTAIIVGVIIFMFMLAGHGLFTLIENLIK